MNNNPINSIDPLGLEEETTIDLNRALAAGRGKLGEKAKEVRETNDTANPINEKVNDTEKLVETLKKVQKDAQDYYKKSERRRKKDGDKLKGVDDYDFPTTRKLEETIDNGDGTYTHVYKEVTHKKIAERLVKMIQNIAKASKGKINIKLLIVGNGDKVKSGSAAAGRGVRGIYSNISTTLNRRAAGYKVLALNKDNLKNLQESYETAAHEMVHAVDMNVHRGLKNYPYNGNNRILQNSAGVDARIYAEMRAYIHGSGYDKSKAIAGAVGSINNSITFGPIKLTKKSNLRRKANAMYDRAKKDTHGLE